MTWKNKFKVENKTPVFFKQNYYLWNGKLVVKEILQKLLEKFKQLIPSNYRGKIKLKLGVVFDSCRFAKETHQIISQLDNKSIIFTPTIDWHMPLFQRPQHLAENLAKLGFQIYYSTTNCESDNVHGFTRIFDNLIVSNQWRHLLRAKKTNFYILAGQPLITIEKIKRLKNNGNFIIYDYADEIDESIARSAYGNNVVARRHQFVKEEGLADLVLCSAQKLYDEMMKYYPAEKLLLCPNGVDYDNFVKLATLAGVPVDLEPILAEKKPIVGYYGALAKWIDYEYLNELVKKRPEYNLVLIGIDYDGSLKEKMNLKASNVHYLGVKKYEDLPRYARHFDCALIPFVQGEIAKATSPLKFFEYMALGLPSVVTKDLVETTKYATTFVAFRKADFLKQVDAAKTKKNDEKFRDELIKIAKKNTWGERTRMLAEKLLSIKS
jgi:glycosyltransferase involved in cell wall biosynthesis